MKELHMALLDFWSGFAWNGQLVPAFPSGRVPENQAFPYITFDVVQGAFFSVAFPAAFVWCQAPKDGSYNVQAQRAEIIKYVVKKGGIVLTNGQPMCKEEMIPGRFSFQEMENDEVDPLPFINSKPPEFRRPAISHLGVPIALGLRPSKYDNYSKRPNLCAQILTKGVITALRNGLVTYPYSFDIRTDGKEDSGSYEMFNKMLPLTPVELNEGFIVGKERTVTALSGNYKSIGKNQPAVFYFNNRGVPRAGKSTVTGKSGEWNVKIELSDWNEVAVIEHK